jgi:predicted secreted hydrolase
VSAQSTSVLAWCETPRRGAAFRLRPLIARPIPPAVSRSALVLVALLALGLAGAAAWLLLPGDDDALAASVAVADAMSSDTTGYRRATEPPAFTFPADHGPHPGFKTEWWYLTGNLATASGRRVGYQYTLFRVALRPPTDDAPDAAAPNAASDGAASDGAAPDGNAPVRPTAASAPDTAAHTWATDQFYMAHFAVSDVATGTHRPFERFSRGAAGLAGAQAQPLRVWLEDWTLAQADPAGADAFPLRLAVSEDGYGVDLTLTPAKPPVYQGEGGLSQKGPEPGNASIYYSYTRLAAEGRVVVGGDTLDVTGTSWMDREWSTSALGDEQEGWDWFALQLDDGRDLMYYQLRRTDGTPSRFSEGVVVGPDGAVARIGRDDVTATVLARWTSDAGVTYPVRWRLRVPAHDLDVTVAAAFPEQVMDVSVRYWEGAVTVEGTSQGAPVTGRGYLEMTGYGDTKARRVS